ncbi:MAG: transporter substrate-binding domain-containing protein [Clostridia bacterium]|nr:transporter substrate-binding domain-containing protein [Clostridia bacterium]
MHEREGIRIDKNLRWIALLVLLAACAAVLTACAVGESPSADGESPRLVIASDDYSPYYYIDDNGDRTGVDVDRAREACRRLGMEPEFISVAWEDKQRVLESGEADCIWGCFTMTGREADYTWAGPYLDSSQRVMVRQSSGKAELREIAGCRVAVQTTGKAEEALLAAPGNGLPEVGHIYSFSSMEQVYACLRKGYADAIAGHEGALLALRSTAPEEYVILPGSIYSSQLGVPLPRGPIPSWPPGSPPFCRRCGRTAPSPPSPSPMACLRDRFRGARDEESASFRPHRGAGAVVFSPLRGHRHPLPVFLPHLADKKPGHDLPAGDPTGDGEAHHPI